MKKLTGIICASWLLLFAVEPLAVFAVSYPVQLYHRQDRHDQFATGETTYLFHSGTDQIRKTIHNNDVLSVYRINISCEVKEVGKVRVVSFIGDTYLQAEVIEGEIKPDDIAKKGKVSCIVISAGVCDH